jgi:hypothetical protein
MAAKAAKEQPLLPPRDPESEGVAPMVVVKEEDVSSSLASSERERLEVSPWVATLEESR